MNNSSIFQFSINDFTIVAAVYVLFLVILAILFSFRDTETKIDGIGGAFFSLLEDTKYATDYSHEGFRQIEIGMTEEEVIDILGEPLSRWQPYTYKNSVEKLHFVGLQYSESPSYTHYRPRQIYLDNGIVAEKIGYFYID